MTDDWGKQATGEGSAGGLHGKLTLRCPIHRILKGLVQSRCVNWVSGGTAPMLYKPSRNRSLLGQSRLCVAAIFVGLLASVLAQAAAETPAPGATNQPATASPATPPLSASKLARIFTSGTFKITDEAGRTILARGAGTPSPDSIITEQDFVAAVGDPARSTEDVAALWDVFASSDAASMPALAMLKALVIATDAPRSREAMWSELGAKAKTLVAAPAQDRALVGMFERHRGELLPILSVTRETEGGGDEMAQLMLHTRIFGADFDASLAHMLERNPGAVARLMERERERGHPAKWEKVAFDGMMRWRTTRLSGSTTRTAQPLDVLDATGEMFITMFNSLHGLEGWYREQMLKGLSPIEVFNAAVGGEQELYRLGTSGYRGFLHPVILRGIKESGSLEAFLQTAARSISTPSSGLAARRGLVFVRIASSFGLLDSVLETVRDRDTFIAEAIGSLGDPRSFESSSTIVVDLLTGRSTSPQAQAFKRILLDRLYASHAAATVPSERSVFGSMLSAYQTVTGDRRSAQIDRDFPLDTSLQRIPFARLFDADGKRGLIHRMFMRLDQDVDAVNTYGSIRTLMRQLRASVRDERNHAVYRVSERNRTVEIYVNKPSTSGVKGGITDIAVALGGARVHTIVGRGHTGIITPLQKDSRRMLGERAREVALVIVGACGGDASVREMIGTYGYVPFVTTKSTGRQVINNEIVEAYVERLLDMQPHQTLAMADVLDQAVAQFLKAKANAELREDARLYHVNVTTVLAARLFDSHVRGIAVPPLTSAVTDKPTSASTTAAADVPRRRQSLVRAASRRAGVPPSESAPPPVVEPYFQIRAVEQR